MSTHRPTPAELGTYLQEQVERLGLRSAHADYAYLQMAAARLWGAQETAFFARVLREHRVTDKPKPLTEWEWAEGSIRRLPTAWQGPMVEALERSRSARLGSRGIIWSAARIRAVAEALVRWAVHCERCGSGTLPTGSTLEAYASHLQALGKVSTNSVGYYLERIVAGYHDIVTRTTPSPGARFVVTRFKDNRTAPTTKFANQIVGASTLFDLGQSLLETARLNPTRGTRAAILARNGILLMVAAALPERSRALSALAFGDTLFLDARPAIRIALPGAVLKGPQARKAARSRRETLNNPALWDALTVYRADFRPIFDGGDALFPSTLAMGKPLAEGHLSQIAGRLTNEHLGVRVTLHRVRDNVATEAVETLPNGIMVAAGVLGHRDIRTTSKHYDRAEGRRAMDLVAALAASKRGKATRLRV